MTQAGNNHPSLPAAGTRGALRGPDVLYSAHVTGADLSHCEAISVDRAASWRAPLITRTDVGAFDFASGISIHWAREVQVAHLETSAMLRPCVSVKLFLEGAVEAWVGDQPLAMPRREAWGAWVATGALVAHRKPVRFRRRAAGGAHLVKVIIDVPHGWFLACPGLGDHPGLQAALQAGLSILPWTPDALDVAQARHLFRLGGDGQHGPALLQAEGIALSLIGSALRSQTAPTVAPVARLDDRARLQAIRDRIAGLPGGPIDVGGLCADLGLSSSTLQRFMQRMTGQSVQAFVRAQRLTEARALLESGAASIATVAWRAGYASPANFSTAFRRAFGLSPSDIRAGRH